MAFTRFTLTIIAVASISILVIACSGSGNGSSGGYTTISAADLQRRLDAGEKQVLVDLREPELFQAGHIPGAINIPFDQFNDRYGELNRNDSIVFICHTGPMGDVTGALLAQHGYAKVANLAGGMALWHGKLEK